jgi:hypothetical protein
MRANRYGGVSITAPRRDRCFTGKTGADVSLILRPGRSSRIAFGRVAMTKPWQGGDRVRERMR